MSTSINCVETWNRDDVALSSGCLYVIQKPGNVSKKLTESVWRRHQIISNLRVIHSVNVNVISCQKVENERNRFFVGKTSLIKQ